ncbi:hypothetical protein K1719_021766 [Acacia pycnantha]|nr:hypothetical protein K1719_021766 [Acacia pycnantha]
MSWVFAWHYKYNTPTNGYPVLQRIPYMKWYADVGDYEANVKRNGLATSQTKVSLFQTKIRFLGHHIHHGMITPIDRAIQFANKFLDQILDETQLQRFLGCLNYMGDFLPQLNNLIKPLYDWLKKNLPP